MNNTDLEAYYKILGLNPGASLSEVKQAYRNLVKTEHPDLFLNNPQLKQEAEEKLKKITKAYEELKKFYQPNSQNQTSHVRSSSTNSSNAATSILSKLRPRLRRILPIVIGLNVANVVVWVFIALNNSNPKTDSSPKSDSSPKTDPSPKTDSSPQTEPNPQTEPSLQTDSNLFQPRQCRVISPTVGRSARVFSQPSKDAYTGRRIPKDTKVSFIGGVREFVEIGLPDRSKGWVFNDQLYPCTPPSNSSLKTDSNPVQPRQCFVVSPTVGRSARVFSQPSKDAYTGIRIPKDTRVSFIGEINEFVEIGLPDRSKGWVFNDQIHPCTHP